MNPHVVVVGAGFGGIAAALRAKALGCDVTIVDKTSHPGGRAQRFQVDGYKHDAGPTVITAPFL
ncbi:FAD-dependent oxidoreductase, partial [Oleiphilus sp. HI0066]|uniref:FAD-dependent oxidoreductase n=4 Tax=Oleiphilus TaxID=141450 RepID=UPI000A7938F4